MMFGKFTQSIRQKMGHGTELFCITELYGRTEYEPQQTSPGVFIYSM